MLTSDVGLGTEGVAMDLGQGCIYARAAIDRPRGRGSACCPFVNAICKAQGAWALMHYIRYGKGTPRGPRVLQTGEGHSHLLIPLQGYPPLACARMLTLNKARLHACHERQ